MYIPSQTIIAADQLDRKIIFSVLLPGCSAKININRRSNENESENINSLLVVPII
jgi:hypothetical protein